MRCIIAGSRTITNYAIVAHAIYMSGWHKEIAEVISGKARGVDSLGIQWAIAKGVTVKCFPPDWDTYGKAAGPIRNEQMAEYADALILVWTGKSKGSASMKRLAQMHGLQIYEHIVSE